MPKAETVFIVTSPEVAGQGPVLGVAEADSIFAGTEVPEAERVIPLPEIVDGELLKAGARLKGFGHIFVERGTDVRPEGLHLIQPEAKRPQLLKEWD